MGILTVPTSGNFTRFFLFLWLLTFFSTITVYKWTTQEYLSLDHPQSSNLPPLFSLPPKKAVTIVPLQKGNDSAVKIVLWVNPSRPIKPERLEQLKNTARIMNRRDKPICHHACHFSVSGSPTKAKEADAVVVHLHNDGHKLKELPAERREDQLWVLYAREAPPMVRWKTALQNVFNWTMSYRTDSDVVTPYGRALPVKKPQKFLTFAGNKSVEEWIRGKSKLVTSVISHCSTPSNRDLLIKELERTNLGAVDVFGACGSQPANCSRQEKDCSEFWGQLASEYSFYLAFENSLCDDYITEKIWRSLELGMVPVVYGRGNYAKEAPPGSFINLRDFKSAKKLMAYLKMLSENPLEYQKYFEWRRHYKVEWNKGDWCILCSALHVRRMMGGNISHKSYADARWWWKHNPTSGARACKRKPFAFKYT